MATATLTPPSTESATTHNRTLKKIETQLLGPARKASLLWQQMAALILQVEEEQLWQGQAKSFTA